MSGGSSRPAASGDNKADTPELPLETAPARESASEKRAVTNGGLERGALPLLERSRRHDVRVAGENDERRCAAAARPEIAHAVAVHAFADEPERLQAFDDHVEAACVVGGNRRARDERLGQSKRIHVL